MRTISILTLDLAMTTAVDTFPDAPAANPPRQTESFVGMNKPTKVKPAQTQQRRPEGCETS